MEEIKNTNENPLIVELTDDKNGKVKVEIVSHFEDQGRTYVIANDLGNDTDSYILELVSTPEGDQLVSVDSEEEFLRLCDVIEKLTEEEEEENKEE